MRDQWTVPPTWAWASVAEIADTTSGGTPRRDRLDYYGGGIPWLKSGELNDGYVDQIEESINELGLAESSAKIFPEGTLCIALYGATVGKLGILRIAAATNQAVCGIFLKPGIDIRYAFRYLQLKRSDLIAAGQGGAQPNISQGIVRALGVPIAPGSEQTRIADCIDELLSDLDAAITALKRVQANLKRYRASVMKAACEGRLVRTEAELAHKEGRTYETGEQLLVRILKERRAKWEAEQLAKMQAAGKPPKDDSWKKKYKEPELPTPSNLLELPEGWTWANIDTVAETIGGLTKGQKRRQDEVLRAVPYLRVANVQRGYLDLAEIKKIEATDEEIQELCLQPDDILFNEGGDRDKLGRGWIWEGQIAECIHQNHVYRARLVSCDVEPRFISYFANSEGQRYFNYEGKQTTNLASINLTKLRAFPVPLPPAVEQQRILAELERQLEYINFVAAACSTGLKRADRLRQSILKRAFDGKLVPQDPNDEPASKLLDRIRTQSKEKPGLGRKAVRIGAYV